MLIWRPIVIPMAGSTTGRRVVAAPAGACRTFAAAENVLLHQMFSTVMRFCVRVPVLSEQITVAALQKPQQKSDLMGFEAIISARYVPQRFDDVRSLDKHMPFTHSLSSKG